MPISRSQFHGLLMPMVSSLETNLSVPSDILPTLGWQTERVSSRR